MIDINKIDFNNTSIELILIDNLKFFICKSNLKSNFNNFNKYIVLNQENEKMILNKMELMEFLRDLKPIKTINFIYKES